MALPSLLHLPYTSGSAAENMAVDQFLLESRIHEPLPCFRHYGWEHAAFTFGFAQPWGRELDHLVAEGCEVVRRETGGGLVDHRQDWTYTLVLPSGYPGDSWCAVAVYRAIHECLVDSLRAQGVDVILKESKAPTLVKGEFSACFRRAEQHDVLMADGSKLAGAAQRRSRAGLLFQGYLERGPLPMLDWKSLEKDFVAGLARWLGLSVGQGGRSAWENETLAEMTARFASEDWNRYRRRIKRA